MPGFASADPAPQPTAVAFPSPGDGYAPVASDITLRDVDLGQISGITVTGSATGAHPGTLSPLRAARGVSFDPATDFEAGEQVTVRVRGVSVAEATGDAYTFTVARPGPAIDPNTIADVQPATGAGVVTPKAAATAATCTPTAHTYVSRPDLGSVPGACTTGPAASATGDKLLATPDTTNTMFDRNGDLVWASKAAGFQNHNLQQLTLNNKPVLAYFEGIPSTVPGSPADGNFVILDSQYNKIHTVRAGNGLRADLHELQLTPQGTALVGVYSPVLTDASRCGGTWFTNAVDYVVQEVELDTGKILFEWHALDHIDFCDSNFPVIPIPFAPWDWFHGNSLQQTPDGNLLLSSRHTWAAYKINRSTGKLMWTLGGKHSDFGPLIAGEGVAAAEAHNFCWQHDARELEDGTFTLFDNGSAIGLPPSTTCGPTRGLQMTLDVPSPGKKGTATLTKVYRHTPDIAASFAGNMETLPDGSRFLGYGEIPQATLFNAAGDAQLDVQLSASSYRAFTATWTGTPTEPPAAVVQQGAVYASWNGATEVASWQVLTGNTAADLQPDGSPQPKVGFETRLALSNPSAAVVRVQARNASGDVIGTSGSSVTGSTYLVGLGSTAPVGPGTLDLSTSTTSGSTLTLRGASLSLPPVTADFSLLFGLIPAQTKLALVPLDQSAGSRIPLTGTFSPAGSSATFQANLRVDDFSVFGFPLQGLLGPTCTTSAPVTVNLSSTGDPRSGAPLTATYAIAPFTGCGLADGLATGALSYPGNTFTLTAS